MRIARVPANTISIFRLTSIDRAASKARLRIQKAYFSPENKCYIRVNMAAVYEKPLTMKDFVQEERKSEIDGSKLYKRVRKLPESRRQKVQSKYSELVDAVAREKRGTYKILLSAIRENLTPKSAYPSLEKAIIQVAKRDGVDFSRGLRKEVNTKSGVRTHVSYPQYVKWKEENMRLRVVNQELFIEKKTDRAL